MLVSMSHLLYGRDGEENLFEHRRIAVTHFLRMDLNWFNQYFIILLRGVGIIKDVII
jgi:hypothetical protein